jgi:hypothetical protein
MRQLCAAWCAAVTLVLLPATAWTQERQADRPDSLSAALRLISGRLDSLVAGLCPMAPIPPPPEPPGEARRDSLAAELRRLTLRLESLRGSRCAAGGPALAQALDTTDEPAGLRAAAEAAADASQPPSGAAAGDSVSPAVPATIPGA